MDNQDETVHADAAEPEEAGNNLAEQETAEHTTEENETAGHEPAENEVTVHEEAAAEPAAEPEAELSAEPAVEPEAAEPEAVSHKAAEDVAVTHEIAAEPEAAEPAEEPAAELAAEPAAEPAAELAAEPAAELAAELAAEPAAEPEAAEPEAVSHEAAEDVAVTHEAAAEPEAAEPEAVSHKDTEEVAVTNDAAAASNDSPEEILGRTAIPPDAHEEFCEAFRLVSEERGYIEGRDVHQLMQALGQDSVSLEEVHKLMDEQGISSDSQLRFADVATLISRDYRPRTQVADDLISSLRVLDRNGNGYLEYDQLYRAMFQIGTQPLDDSAREDFDQLVRLADKDQGGRIDYSNFCHLITMSVDELRRRLEEE